jgi:hypothetical protein
MGQRQVLRRAGLESEARICGLRRPVGGEVSVRVRSYQFGRGSYPEPRSVPVLGRYVDGRTSGYFVLNRAPVQHE